jgi:hypothetical protein
VPFEIPLYLGDRQDRFNNGFVGRSCDIQTSSLSWTARCRVYIACVFISILLVPAPVPSGFEYLVGCRERPEKLLKGVVVKTEPVGEGLVEEDTLALAIVTKMSVVAEDELDDELN